MKKKRHQKESKDLIKRGKLALAIIIILRLLVIAVLIDQVIKGNWDNVFTCVLALVLFMVPSFFERRLKIEVPDLLEIIILIFIFAAEILGEIQGYYIVFERWDTVLHTLNGFICAAIGFSLIDLLNRHERVELNLSPSFVAFVAFCFSMTVGVIWEFFEFSIDYFVGIDMQKDTWISQVNSMSLNSSNQVTSIPVDEVVLNGKVTWGQYLDIGLYDTMKDLFVNLIGAVIFSVVGLIYIKNRGSGFVSKLIPVVLDRTEKDK